MEVDCEGCKRSLAAHLEVHRCSHGCTFCDECARENAGICPHCGGELLRQWVSPEPEGEELIPDRKIKRKIWLASFAVWTFVSLAATVTIYELYRPLHNSFNLKEVAGMEFSQILTYAPLTPFFFMLALRFPIQRENWRRRSLLHLLFGLAFTLGHILLKAATPYGYWDRVNREWTFAIWDSHTHSFRPLWPVLQSMFLSSVVDDLSGAYASIALVAHALSYYRKSRQGGAARRTARGPARESPFAESQEPTAAAFSLQYDALDLGSHAHQRPGRRSDDLPSRRSAEDQSRFGGNPDYYVAARTRICDLLSRYRESALRRPFTNPLCHRARDARCPGSASPAAAACRQRGQARNFEDSRRRRDFHLCQRRGEPAAAYGGERRHHGLSKANGHWSGIEGDARAIAITLWRVPVARLPNFRQSREDFDQHSFAASANIWRS